MQLNKYIDHTLLKADATPQQVINLCNEAKQYNFASVCTNGNYTSLVAEQLKGSGVKSCAVVGFPLGAMATKAKVYEAQLACRDGANEIDMVLDIGQLKAGNDGSVYEDIKAVVQAVHQHKAIVKVIIESSLLSDEEKVKACNLAVTAGADFVKTSTGFSTGGATIEDVKLMLEVVKDKAQVKASGGIKSASDALAMVKAGATRLGTSNGIAIMRQEECAGGY
ncbi:MAG: deoxyribose-phosphate aldolase [Spirochaetaceae bacterium]|nr:deoxyribose-phosphate aldolase [Spirochaetaceae bacterium]